MINNIIINNEIAAVLIPKDFAVDEGIKFYSKKNDEFQIGLMRRPKEYKISPHYHTKKIREIKHTSEALIVKKGSIKCCFFNQNDKNDTKSIIINEGDILIILKYAHSFDFLEESEVVEIKQGPFIETKQISDDTSK